jgi:coenzyme PQQ precursor peptide PqqA
LHAREWRLRANGDCVRDRCDLGSLFAEPREERPMTWTTPTLVEICIGLEINGYLPAEF